MTTPYAQYIREPRNNEEQKIFDLQELYMGPVPPLRFIRNVKAFWLVYVDHDGRSWAPAPYSWQPTSQRWCRINEEATGRNLDLRHHVIIGEVVMPNFPILDITVGKAVTVKPADGWESPDRLRPDPGFIVKRWKNGAMWAGYVDGGEKSGSCDQFFQLTLPSK